MGSAAPCLQSMQAVQVANLAIVAPRAAIVAALMHTVGSVNASLHLVAVTSSRLALMDFVVLCLPTARLAWAANLVTAAR